MGRILLANASFLTESGSWENGECEITTRSIRFSGKKTKVLKNYSDLGQITAYVDVYEKKRLFHKITEKWLCLLLGDDSFIFRFDDDYSADFICSEIDSERAKETETKRLKEQQAQKQTAIAEIPQRLADSTARDLLPTNKYDSQPTSFISEKSNHRSEKDDMQGAAPSNHPKTIESPIFEEEIASPNPPETMDSGKSEEETAYSNLPETIDLEKSEEKAASLNSPDIIDLEESEEETASSNPPEIIDLKKSEEAAPSNPPDPIDSEKSEEETTPSNSPEATEPEMSEEEDYDYSGPEKEIVIDNVVNQSEQPSKQKKRKTKKEKVNLTTAARNLETETYSLLLKARNARKDADNLYKEAEKLRKHLDINQNAIQPAKGYTNSEMNESFDMIGTAEDFDTSVQDIERAAPIESEPSDQASNIATPEQGEKEELLLQEEPSVNFRRIFVQECLEFARACSEYIPENRKARNSIQSESYLFDLLNVCYSQMDESYMMHPMPTYIAPGGKLIKCREDGMIAYSVRIKIFIH